MDLFITTSSFYFTDINWWNGSGVDCLWIVFIFFSQLFGHSIWRHPFTADDPLMSNDVKLKGWVHFQQIFMFVWSTVFLNCKLVSWIIQMCHMWCSCSYYFLRVCLKGDSSLKSFSCWFTHWWSVDQHSETRDCWWSLPSSVLNKKSPNLILALMFNVNIIWMF